MSLGDVQAVYSGAEGDLWELLMGQQIHVGGLASSQALAEQAAVGPGQHGVDLCCCTGAGMRFLVRFRDVASMVGVDATPRVVERGRQRCQEEGLSDRIRFVLGDACDTGLPRASADFVWGEDAWCYVTDKERLVAEAARILKPGGTIAFTDWVEGPGRLSPLEAERLFGFMKFPNLQSLEGYGRLLEANGCRVLQAEDTGRFTEHIELYREMVDKQLTYDVLRIVGFEPKLLDALREGMSYLAALGREAKLVQGRVLARKP